MNLRQIEIFYHVYRTGSISGAARELNVSQPSVSKVLRHAEDGLGFALFVRSKSRLTATPAAHELFDEVTSIYEQLTSFNRSIENMRKRRGGHLRMGVLPSLSLSVGPELAAQLCQNDDELSLELTTLHSNEIAGSLIENQADFCIGFTSIEHERIQSKRIGSGGFVLVANRQLSQDGEAVDLSIINNADFIGMKESGPLAAIVSASLNEQAICPNEIVTAHTYHVALSLVRKGTGIAITDQFTAYSHLGTGLQRYPIAALPRFDVFAAYRSEHPYEELIVDAIANAEQVLKRLERGILALQNTAS